MAEETVRIKGQEIFHLLHCGGQGHKAADCRSPKRFADAPAGTGKPRNNANLAVDDVLLMMSSDTKEKPADTRIIEEEEKEIGEHVCLLTPSLTNWVLDSGASQV